MKSLFLLCFLIILLIHFSTQLESGDGDTEPEDPPTLCHNPYNSSQNMSSSNQFIFDNSSDALQYGQCLSACLAELLLNSTLGGPQNTFPATAGGKNFIWLSYDAATTRKDDQYQCHLLHQMLECGRGCLIRYRINYDKVLCNDLCFNSCRNSSDDICYNCEDKCSLGCAMELPTVQENEMTAPPTLLPLFVQETDKLGIYSVNLSYHHDEGSGLFVSHEGSGSPMSPLNFLTLVLNITTISNDTNMTVTKFISEPTLFTKLDLRSFLCQEVWLSYVWINQDGITSNYSESIKINVKGVNISQPLPVPSVSFIKEMKYDYRQGYFGHYLVNLSWFNPIDVVSISRYEIHLEHGQYLNHCRKAIYDVLPHYNEARTSYLIKASDPNQPPFSRCQYDLKIVSIPVDSSFHPVNTSFYISIPTYPPDRPNLKCSHFLNSKGEYTVTIDLLITEYLAAENVVDSVSIIPDLLRYDSDRQRILDQDSGTLVELTTPESARRFMFNITQDFKPKSTDNFVYEFSVTLDWDYSLVYRPTIHTDKCSFNPLSPTPQTMNLPSLLHPVTRLTISSVRILLTWERPTIINGFFHSYELSLNFEPLSALDELSQNSQTPTLPITNVSQTTANWIASFIPKENVHCMYLQIRVKNTYRSGNWSVPLTIPLDSKCIIITNGTNTIFSAIPSPSLLSPSLYPPSQSPHSQSSSHSLPVSYPVMVTLSTSPTQSVTLQQTHEKTNVPLAITTTIAGVVVLLVTSIVAVLCVHWQMRRRKRRMELIREDLFRDPIFSFMGPRMTHHLNDGIEIIQDSWEIPAANVIIECEIGHGEFGEVFKGIITDSKVTTHARKILTDSNTNNVAVKLLKTTATGIEKRDFLNEIDLMKQISQGNNSHVVNMIGCVTCQEPLCLITEFVKHGDLLSYLRTSRKMARDESTTVNPYPDLDELQSSDLLSFAYQIASGMEFLSSLDIVHRDLACRNVLVGEGKALKISDYGMSRMVEAGDTYVKTTRGKLPLKWMAIESITDREFTTASDVWAYGVTLWEIGTLGGFPYPTVNNDELLTRLKLGYRMECPDNCSREIYDIMLECWKEAPNKRPTFSQLRTKVDHLLSSAQQSNAYIDLRTDEHNDIYTAPSEDEENNEMEDEEEEERDEEKKKGSFRLSPSPSKRGGSPSYTSIASANSFMMTNPMFLEIDHNSRHDADGILRLSPRSYRSHHSPQRPTSLAMWDCAGENAYVDEPAIIGPGIEIHVSVSTPTSPVH